MGLPDEGKTQQRRNKKMKKLIALLLSVAMIAAFSSCGQSDNSGTSSDGTQVKVAGMVYLEVHAYGKRGL